MSEHDYITLRRIPLRHINAPENRALVRRFAEELAPPCVAEALMALLRRAA